MKTIYTFTFLMLSLGIFFSVSAQRELNVQQMQIDIIKAEDGDTNTSQELIPIDDNTNAKDIIEQIGIENELEKLEDDEIIEIQITRKKDNEVIEEQMIELNPLQQITSPPEPVVPPAIMKPPAAVKPSPKVIERIDNEPAVKKPAFLGVYFRQLSPYRAQMLDLDHTNGAYVTGVIDNTEAQDIGLQTGDVILKIDDQIPTNDHSLLNIIRSYHAEDKIKITYWRDGKTKTISATLRENTRGNLNQYYENENWDNFDMNKLFEWNENNGHGWNYDNRENQNDTKQAFLGVNISSHDDGVLVTGVVANSTASKIGLKEGDVIIKINGMKTPLINDLQKAIRSISIGDKINVTFLRDNKEIQSNGTLGSKDTGCAQPSNNRLNDQLENLSDAFSELSERIRKSVEDLDLNGNALDKLQRDFGIELPFFKNEVVSSYKAVISMLDISQDEARMLRLNDKPNNELAAKYVTFSPNPNDGQFKIRFQLPETGDTEIAVFDAEGKQVYWERLDHFSGMYNERIDISGNPKGTYFLTIQQNGKVFGKKIIVQ